MTDMEKARRIISGQSRLLGTMRKMIRYYCGMGITEVRDYAGQGWLPVEIKVQVQARNVQRKAKKFLEGSGKNNGN